MMLLAGSGEALGVGFLLLFWLLIIVVGLGGLVLGIWGLIDSMGKPDWAWTQAGENRTNYLVTFVIGSVACQLVSFIAAIMYFRTVKPKLLAAMAQGPSPYWQGGYGQPPGYGYGGPPGYTTQPGYGQPSGYGQPQPGYSPPSGYGQAPGYSSPQPGYGQPQPPVGQTPAFPPYAAPGSTGSPWGESDQGDGSGESGDGSSSGPVQF